MSSRARAGEVCNCKTGEALVFVLAIRTFANSHSANDEEEDAKNAESSSIRRSMSAMNALRVFADFDSRAHASHSQNIKI